MNFKIDQNLSSALSLEENLVPVAGAALLESRDEADFTFTNQVRLADRVDVDDVEGQLLLASHGVGEDILPLWILAAVVTAGGFVGLSSDVDLDDWVHLSEGFSVVG